MSEKHSGVDPATLLPALLQYFGGPTDIFIVRLLGQPRDEAIRECEWRAVGQWDANDLEGCAAFYALKDVLNGETRKVGWGDQYQMFWRNP